MDTTQTYSAVLGDRGRLVLPAPLRERFDLHPGDRLIFTMDENGGFRVVSARELAKRMQGCFSHIAPGHSLVDELIAERREEARRESEE